MGLQQTEFHLFRWILYLLVLEIPGCLARVGPRAVPNHMNQNQDIYWTNIISSPPSELPFNLDLCPWGQVGHAKGDSVICCIPVSCPPGHSIQACNVNGNLDKCVPCAHNLIQPNYVWSFNMDEAQCFFEDEPSKCYDQEENPSNIFMSYECRKRCQCKWADCYYQTANCYCDFKRVCDPNFTMDRKTGDCLPCPFGTYKNFNGCAPCLLNDTLLRLGTPGKMNVSQTLEPSTTPQPPVITTQDQVELTVIEQPLNQKTVEKIPVWAIVVGVVLAVLMICLMGHVLICRIQYLREKLSCFCFYRCFSPSREGVRHVVYFDGGEARAINRQQVHGNLTNRNAGEENLDGGNNAQEVNAGWEGIGGPTDEVRVRGHIQGQGQDRGHRSGGGQGQRYQCRDDVDTDQAPVHQPLLGRRAEGAREISPEVSEALKLARALSTAVGMQGNNIISDSTFYNCVFNGNVVNNGRNGSDSSNPSSPLPSVQPEILKVDLDSKRQDEKAPEPVQNGFVTQETGANGDSKVATGRLDRPWIVPDLPGGRPNPGCPGFSQAVGPGPHEGGQGGRSPDMQQSYAAGAQGAHASAHHGVAMSNLKNGSVERPQAVIRPMQQHQQSFISGPRRQALNHSDNPLSFSMPSYIMPHPENASPRDSLSSDLNVLEYENQNFNHRVRNDYSQRPCGDGVSLFNSTSLEEQVLPNRPDYHDQTEVKRVFRVNTDNTEVKVIEGQGHRNEEHPVSAAPGMPDRDGRLRLASGEVVERVVEGQSTDASERLVTPTFPSLGSSDSSFELDNQQVQDALARGGPARGGSKEGTANVGSLSPDNSDSFELPLDIPLDEPAGGNDIVPPVPTAAANIDNQADSDASVELPLDLDMH